MFVDASALTAMLTDETDARELLARAQNYPVRFTSPLAVWETVIAVARVLGIGVQSAAVAVEDFLALIEIEVRPVPAEARGRALEAFDRFGKGRHPSALNFGDCFAYGCAHLAGAPLLYKCDDFPQTDIETA
jgi:ribonuclease VapC